MSDTDYPNAVELEVNPNIRHFGGYEAANGKTVVQKKLIRSGIPVFTENDIRYLLNEYNLKYVIDLRGPREAAENPSLVDIPGVQYFSIPFANISDSQTLSTVHTAKAGNSWIEMFYQAGGTIEAAISYMMGGYIGVITEETYIQQARKCFDLFLENENDCVLFHCAGGKDRTGILAALLLSALGVSWDTVMENYLLSNIFLSTYINEQLEGVLAETDDPEVIEGVKIFFTADSRLMDRALQTIEENYGSIDHYFSVALQLTSEEIDRLREIYTE